MNRKAPCILVTLILALGACGDGVLAPNTEVGLRVWTEAHPNSLSIGDSSGTIAFRLYVMNPSRSAISVISGGPPYVFTTDPANTRGLFGSIRIACDENPLNCGPSVDWWGDSVYTFAPRRTVYDEYTVTLRDWAARGWALSPGRYRARGWFNAREGDSADFVLTP